MSVRVRIAPSPTGDPHVGTAYIALFNHAFARSKGGQFILRIEDTDRTRSTLDSEKAILRALTWVGLSWDEGPDVGGPYGPYRQSERTAIYAEHAHLLIEKRRAYRCFCTEQRLMVLREQQKREKRPPGYDGHCRGLAREESDQRAAVGEPFVVRLAMPKAGTTTFTDGLRGKVEIDNSQVDDQVLLKSDGFPTYHLANVVDDHLMKISHVIRAEEWISSTPKHVELYAAFGWDAPEFIHMPLLRNSDRSKISKRKNPVSLDYYADAGILPEAMLNFLGLMGWSLGNDQEKFSLAQMIASFDIYRVRLGEPVFNLEKLDWLNAQWLKDLSDAEIVARLRGWRLSDDKLAQLVKLSRDRMRRLDDFIGIADFFLAGDLELAPVLAELVPKERQPAEVATILGELTERLETIRGPWLATMTEPLVRAFTEEKAWKPKELFMTLRVAMSGRKTSPPLFESMEVMGKELVRRRLRLAIELLAKPVKHK
jgi:glutamyl-tRNA synthetase